MNVTGVYGFDTRRLYLKRIPQNGLPRRYATTGALHASGRCNVVQPVA